MSPQLPLWRYRAYDEQYVIHEGLAHSESLPTLALALRQQGLQIIAVERVSDAERLIEKRLMRLKTKLIPIQKPKKARKSLLDKLFYWRR